MIIQLKGKVNFPITLDPTVWIFDDRKILLEEAFIKKEGGMAADQTESTEGMFDQLEYSLQHMKPPVNKSLDRFEREQALTHSFVMPIGDFINIAEIQKDAQFARLKTGGDDIIISIEQLRDACMLFAINGKMIKDEGPVHFFFGDGSNKDSPFKGIKQIIIE